MQRNQFPAAIQDHEEQLENKDQEFYELEQEIEELKKKLAKVQHEDETPQQQRERLAEEVDDSGAAEVFEELIKNTNNLREPWASKRKDVTAGTVLTCC